MAEKMEKELEFNNEKLLLRRKAMEALRDKGIDDSEAQEVFIRWCEIIEAEANLANTSEANIEVEIQKAKVYSEAGYKDYALELLYDYVDHQGMTAVLGESDQIKQKIYDSIQELKGKDKY